MFKVGYYYKYTGDCLEIYNADLIDRKWRKCIYADYDGQYFWSKLEDEHASCVRSNLFFIESKYNPNIKKKIRKILEK